MSDEIISTSNISYNIKYYGGPESDQGYCIRTTSDGGFVIVGVLKLNADDYQIYLLRLNTKGDTLWTKKYGGPFQDRGYSVIQTSDGGFAITGCKDTSDIGSTEMYLIRTDENGDSLWTKIFKGSQGHAIQQTSDDGFILTGYFSNMYLVKTDASGNLLWEKNFVGPCNSGLSSTLDQTSSGGFILGGHFQINDLFEYYAGLVLTDNNGDSLWLKTYADGDEIFSVKALTDGGFVFTGETNETDSKLLLVKTDQNGNTLWTKTYGEENYDYIGFCVIQTSDGNIVTAGAGEIDLQDDITHIFVIKTDINGNTLWEKKIDNTDYQMPRSIVETADGNIAITGRGENPKTSDVDLIFILIDSDGDPA